MDCAAFLVGVINPAVAMKTALYPATAPGCLSKQFYARLPASPYCNFILYSNAEPPYMSYHDRSHFASCSLSTQLHLCPPCSSSLSIAMPTPKLNPITLQLVGKRINRNLQLISILGQGAYGVVYLALDTDSSVDSPVLYAVKCLAKAGLDTRQQKFQRREIALHRLASGHPGVVTLHKVVEDEECIYVILDLCTDGDLFTMITERQMYLGNDALIKDVFLQIVSAVEYCHEMGIHHRDLKPENILCRNGGTTLLLGDFGLATSEKTSEAFGCGSSFYMSPGMSRSFLERMR